jgi:hypothetical protein
MNKIWSLQKPNLIFFILLTVISLPPMLRAQSFEEDEYLTKAFAALKENPPPAPTARQNELIIQVKDEIEKAAAQKNFYMPPPELAAQIGETGFPALAGLLRSPNPWTRALAARTLFLLDRPRSLPFLIGQLFDKGRFDYMDDVAEYTVSAQAGSLLGQAIHGTNYFTTPVRDASNPSAKVKAIQNYYWFHLPFCKWMNKVCFIDNARMFTELENTRFGKSANDDGYEGVNYVFVGNFSKDDRFRSGTPVDINFGFLHYGNRIRKIRWDLRDTSIHKFKLVAPGGRVLKLKPEGLPLLDKLYPVLQPQWNQSSMGKDLELTAMYDINQPGFYRLYYEYQPPPPEREADEQSRPLHLWHWDGKDYVNHYEFIVE